VSADTGRGAVSHVLKKPLKKLRKLIRWFSLAFTAAALLVMYTPAANLLARTLTRDPPPVPERAGLIAVLGGGAFADGSLTGASNERLIKGLLLYRQGRAPRVIFLGGTIVSTSTKIIHTVAASRDRRAITVPEGGIMREVAVGLGLAPDVAAWDPLSPNTRENIVNLKAYMEENGIRDCLLVTSATHMLRASLLASKAGLECAPAPVRDYTPYITGPVGRVSLMYTVAWEYAALALYWLYGYI